MKKISLNLGSLEVESFETFVRDDQRGTVNAFRSCATWSCGGTCGAAPDSLVEKLGNYAGTFGCTNNGACCV